MAEEKWTRAATIGCWTDACEEGFGGGYLRPDGTMEYFYGRWPQNHGLCINALELATASLAVRAFGEYLRGRSVFFHIDNEAAKFVLNRGTGRSAAMMVAQREIVLDQLKHGFRMRGKYI